MRKVTFATTKNKNNPKTPPKTRNNNKMIIKQRRLRPLLRNHKYVTDMNLFIYIYITNIS